MFRQLFFCGVLSVALLGTTRASLPPGFTPCNAGDHPCIIGAINNVLNTYYEGNDDLHLRQFDPLVVPSMVWARQAYTDVDFELRLEPLVQLNHRYLRADSVSGFGTDLAGPHKVHFVWPNGTILQGNYSARGSLYGETIDGYGPFEIDAGNLTITIEFSGYPTVKNGSNYLTVQNFVLEFSTFPVVYSLQNLRDGNATVSQQLTETLTNNWGDVTTKFYYSIVAAWSPTYRALTAGVFDSNPYGTLLVGGN